MQVSLQLLAHAASSVQRVPVLVPRTTLIAVENRQTSKYARIEPHFSVYSALSLVKISKELPRILVEKSKKTRV